MAINFFFFTIFPRGLFAVSIVLTLPMVIYGHHFVVKKNHALDLEIKTLCAQLSLDAGMDVEYRTDWTLCCFNWCSRFWAFKKSLILGYFGKTLSFPKKTRRSPIKAPEHPQPWPIHSPTIRHTSPGNFKQFAPEKWGAEFAFGGPGIFFRAMLNFRSVFSDGVLPAMEAPWLKKRLASSATSEG